MAETMYPFEFEQCKVVQRLTEIYELRHQVPPEGIELMTSAVTSGKSILLMEAPDNREGKAAFALVSPGHDQGWLLFHLWVTDLASGRKVHGQGLLDPKNQVFTLIGEPVKKDAMVFHTGVSQALTRWRS